MVTLNPRKMSWAEFVEAFQPVRPTSDDRVDLTALHMRCSAARQEESHDTELRRDREADPGRARAPPGTIELIPPRCICAAQQPARRKAMTRSYDEIEKLPRAGRVPRRSPIG